MKNVHSFIEGTGGDLRIALIVVRDGDSPRPAADLTVFDVILNRPAARVDPDFVRFAAVGTYDDPLGVGGAVAEGKRVVQVVVGEVDHQSPHPIRCRSAVTCAV